MRRWLWKRNGIQRVSGESKEILGRRSVRRISACLVLGTVIEIHELCFTHFNNGDERSSPRTQAVSVDIWHSRTSDLFSIAP